MDLMIQKLEDFSYWAQEKKAEDVQVVEVGQKSSFTDYFVICSANGSIHTKAVAENILEKAKEKKYILLGKEGLDNGKWILLDYGDVVIHIFDTPVREHYQIEELWKKLPQRMNDN